MKTQKLLRKLEQLMARWPNRDRARQRRPRVAERGMTLVEIMVVVVIISLVAGVVGVAVFGTLGDAQRKTAFTQIQQISDALDLYRLQYRRYPSTAEGLQALASPKGRGEPIMNEIPRDPWGNDYVYVFPGTRNPRGFDLLSTGPDEQEGTDDDVSNWAGLGDGQS